MGYPASYDFPRYNDSGSKAYTTIHLQFRDRKKAELAIKALQKNRLRPCRDSARRVWVDVPTVYYRDALYRVDRALSRAGLK